MPKDDSEHADNQPLKHEGWKDIREKPRWCTDCIFLLLLFASWFAMTIIGFTVIGWISSDKLNKGNPARLTNAIDYDGNICGYTSGYHDLKNAYYLLDLSVVCVDSCPTENDYTSFICKYGVQPSSTTEGYEDVEKYDCNYQVKTIRFLNRCIPNTDTQKTAEEASAVAADNGVTISSSFLEYSSDDGKHSTWFTKFLGDLITLRAYIGGFGIAFSTGLSFLYLYFLRIPGLLRLLMWVTIIALQALLIISTVLLLTLAKSWSDDNTHSHTEVVALKTFGYFLLALSVLYFCLVVVLRKRLNLAVTVVQHAAKALASVPTLLALPVVQVIGTVMFLVPWFIYIIYLASSGDIKTVHSTYTYDGATVDYSYREISYTKDTGFVFLYLLFCWFWTSEFIVAFGQLVVALTFTAYYFHRDKSTIGSETVRWAFKTTGIYHAGTAAFGSLIIAVVKTVRAIIYYIQKKAEKTGNKIVECAAKCLGCLVWCLEEILKFINKHAYIMTAIYGYSFCKASRTGFFVILRNILRVAAVNLLAWFILFLGTLFIPLLTTFIAYLAIAYGTRNDDISGIMGPLVFIFLLAFWITSIFMEIFGMGIETILICFIADEEMFPVGERFAEGELVTAMNKTHEDSKVRKFKDVVVKPKEEHEIALVGDAVPVKEAKAVDGAPASKWL